MEHATLAGYPALLVEHHARPARHMQPIFEAAGTHAF